MIYDSAPTGNPPALHFAAYESEDFLTFFEYERNHATGSGHLEDLDDTALEALAEIYASTQELRMFLSQSAFRHFSIPRNWHAGYDADQVRLFLERLVLDREAMHAAGFGKEADDHPPRLDNMLDHMSERFASHHYNRLDSGQLAEYLSDKQRVRGYLSGRARRQGKPLEKEPEPWKAAGVSRRTWYRRQKGENTGRHGGRRAGSGRRNKSSGTEPI